MAWTCSKCGTKNDSGLFNFCKKCGTTPARGPSAAPSQPTARTPRPEPAHQPHVVQSTWTGGTRRRRSGSNVFAFVILLVVLAAGAVIAIASRVDIEDALRDLTATDPAASPGFTVDTDSIFGGLSQDLEDMFSQAATGAETAPVTEATAPGESTEPTVTAPAVAPTLATAGRQDIRCSNRWNGKQNARARRAIVQAADGEKLWAGVQRAPATSGTSVGTGVCVVIFGTQPDTTRPALRPNDVYAEAGPSTGPRLPFVRLSSVSLSYAWNARVAKDGRILPKTAG